MVLQSTGRSGKNKYLQTHPALICASWIGIKEGFSLLPSLPRDLLGGGKGWNSFHRDPSREYPGAPSRGGGDCEIHSHALTHRAGHMEMVTNTPCPRGGNISGVQHRLHRSHSLLPATNHFLNHSADATEGGDLSRGTRDSPEQLCHPPATD